MLGGILVPATPLSVATCNRRPEALRPRLTAGLPMNNAAIRHANIRERKVSAIHYKVSVIGYKMRWNLTLAGRRVANFNSADEFNKSARDVQHGKSVWNA